MKRFLALILLFLGIPVLLILGVYMITDPYKTHKDFSLTYFDDINRDYLSTELWIMNYPKQQYDSYIFGSSRGCGINTYHWLKYLPKGSNQFLFQGWGETITGMEQKISYIDSKGLPLRNVIILIDYPDSFKDVQKPTDAVCIKHPLFSGQSNFLHESILFWGFAQKPSQWINAISIWWNNEPPVIGFDTVSNDWCSDNKFRDLSVPPEKDSLRDCSVISKNVFLKTNEEKTDEDLPICDPVIDEKFSNQIKHIREIFDNHDTDYKIVITPGYCYTDPKVNKKDLEILNDVFGKGNVFDFSGKNYMTSDYNNYSDSKHFGLWVGWHIIEEIVGGNQ